MNDGDCVRIRAVYVTVDLLLAHVMLFGSRARLLGILEGRFWVVHAGFETVRS